MPPPPKSSSKSVRAVKDGEGAWVVEEVSKKKPRKKVAKAPEGHWVVEEIEVE
jgi:hypothetical protein